MLKCAYAIFCEDVNLNTSTNQISADGFFSELSLDGPGTTHFSFVIGVWGLKKGKTGSLEIFIKTPDEKGFGGSWTSPKSIDETEVYTAIFNCSKIPFQVEGNYVFSVIDSNEGKVISQRILRVNFSNGEED